MGQIVRFKISASKICEIVILLLCLTCNKQSEKGNFKPSENLNCQGFLLAQPWCLLDTRKRMAI